MNAPGSAIPRLVTGSIPGHLLSQTLPAIIGVAAIMSIGIVDAYFIGQLGSEALAAVSFIFPVAVASTSLGVGVMVGINSVVARALGEGDFARAARRANLGIVFALGCGVVMGLALWAVIDPIFAAMNAQPALMPLSRRTGEVAASMDEANAGAAGAAAASDEFALSINEISRQAASSSELARLA